MMTALGDADCVAALFSDRLAAEAAVVGLGSLGIADEHLGVAVHEPGQVVFEDDVESDEVIAVEEGVLVGVPLGGLAGMSLVAVALPGVGGVVGLTTADHGLEERRVWEGYALRPGEIIVVARGHHQPARVREALEKHSGSLVDLQASAGLRPQI